MRIWNLLFGIWGLSGAAACALFALGIFPSVPPKHVLAALLLFAIVPFGFTAALMSRIGWNTDKYDSPEGKARFRLRTFEVWRRFPLTTASCVLLPMASLAYQLLRRPDDLQNGASFIMAFNLISAFVNLRLVPAGADLMEKWDREDETRA